MDGEAYGDGEEQKSEDEDESYWFDCCDDSDVASSGDEDYGKSYKFSDEETDDEENLEVEQEVNAKEAEVKDEEDEEMVDVPKKEENKIVPIDKRMSITAKEYVQLLSGGVDIAVGAKPIDASVNFHIKVYVNQHTCFVTERSARCTQATKDILGVLYKNFVGGVGPGVGYWKAHRTLKYARELVRGSQETGYKDLPEYLYRIRRANPGTLTRLEVDELDRFKRKQAALMTTVLTKGVEKALESRVIRASKLSVQEIDPHQYEDEACSVPDSVTGKSVNQPFVKVKSGRPKMSRIKGHLEVASPRKVPRKAYACSNCGNVGHNRLSCKA
ncbi:unnamed protein product [Arabidopsis arenosa]|uniref:CCHC-type domain-containing protein n=1 Tax=Arabidopsis arenosa TaxID=38785 RepID=A0A8S2A1A0_ARAAE|nr:unnamed protein product [Arabidopsis arenosa]